MSYTNPAEKPAAASESWCHTMCNSVLGNYTWTIHNFAEVAHKELLSDKFALGNNGKTEWKLMCRTRKSSGNLDLLHVHVKLQTSSTAYAAFGISLLNEKLERKLSAKSNAIRSFAPGGPGWGFFNFISLEAMKDKKNDYLSGNNLVILCEMTVRDDPVNKSGSLCISSANARLVKDFGAMYESKKFSDVTIMTTDGKEIKAHKTVLAHRSPVFAAKFDTDMMKKNCENRVEITNIEHNVLNEVLRYIYTGAVDLLQVLARELLIAADEFELGELKDLCVAALCKNLSVDNVIECLTLADFHSCEKLKAAALELIQAKLPEVIESTGFATMQVPNFIKDVLRFLGTKKMDECF